MESSEIQRITVPYPDHPIEESEGVCVAYVNDDGGLLFQDLLESSQNSQNSGDSSKSHHPQHDFDLIRGELTTKFDKDSRQNQSEISGNSISSGSWWNDIIDPPYPPKCLANFLEVDPVLFRAVKAKTLDSVGREILFRSTKPIRQKGQKKSDEPTITSAQYREDKEKIERFIANCNSVLGFRSVLERAAMDFEGIGWAAIEVIRSTNGQIRKLEHVPAQRIRVLRGFKGFAEITTDGSLSDLNYKYYQLFGQKFLVKDELGELVPYDPVTHGPNPEFTPNFRSYTDGSKTSDFNQSANEILYIPKNHSNTIYYGYSDAIPALGAVVGNVYIRDYILQFFEHNTVPRYAVIIKGAKIDEQFRKSIQEYFHQHVKGQSHKTLILTLQGMGHKDLDIEFKPLDVMHKEADFLQTRKENSNLIMTAMGTSPAILGIAESSELGSGKGLSQAEIYKDRVVTPCQRYWAEKLNYLFSVGLGVTHARIDFDPLDIRDMMLEMQYYTGLQTMGNLSNNEVRRDMGLGEPVDGGDTHYVRIKEGSAYKVSDLPKLKLPEPPPAPAPATQEPDDNDNEVSQSDDNPSDS